MGICKTNNQKLLAWVEDVAAMCTPDAIEWVDGSEAEYARLTDLLCEAQDIRDFYVQYRDRLPNALVEELHALVTRLLARQEEIPKGMSFDMAAGG